VSLSRYKALVVEAVAGVLGPVGFRKSGPRFSRPLEDVVHLVSVQSSIRNSASCLRVTINLGVWIPELEDPGTKPDVWSAHWRERLGFLMPEPSDRWWEARSEIEAAAAGSEIGHALTTFAFPAFDDLRTADALAALWRSGQAPGLTELEARRYLDALGRPGVPADPAEPQYRHASMSDRSYTLVEVPVERRLWPEYDLIVRVFEHVRRNLRFMAPDIPAECEVDLLAAGTAHNVGPRPILGIYSSPNTRWSMPDWQSLDRIVSDWCGLHSDEELRQIARATDAPTWTELQAVGVHPRRA
jgi:hypothetical protein